MAAEDNLAAERRLTIAAFARITALREARGWSGADIVERMPSKFRNRLLDDYKSGRSRMSLARFVQIMEVLEADPGAELNRVRAAAEALRVLGR